MSTTCDLCKSKFSIPRPIVVDCETLGLSPLQQQIVAIGFMQPADTRVTILYHHPNPEYTINQQDGFTVKYFKTEKEMLEAFWSHVHEHRLNTFVGFNSSFDHSFLKIRTAIHQVKGRSFRKWYARKDVRALFLGDYRVPKKEIETELGDGKGDTTLRAFAECLGLENTDDFDGSQVPTFYAEGKHDEIVSHLVSDVFLTTKMWNILQACGITDE